MAYDYKAWRERNRERTAAYQREWRSKNKEKFADYQAKYRANGGTEVFDKWREDNRDHILEYARNYAKVHRKEKLEAQKRYRKNNAGKVNARNNKRYADKINATPSWANLGYIKLFYEMAQKEALRIGEAVEVDHIFPLQADWVCGLHVEDNLQLLTKTANARKNNTTSIGSDYIKYLWRN